MTRLSKLLVITALCGALQGLAGGVQAGSYYNDDGYDAPPPYRPPQYHHHYKKYYDPYAPRYHAHPYRQQYEEPEYGAPAYGGYQNGY